MQINIVPSNKKFGAAKYITTYLLVHTYFLIIFNYI